MALILLLPFIIHYYLLHVQQSTPDDNLVLITTMPDGACVSTKEEIKE
jgi:hypothetical protein